MFDHHGQCHICFIKENWQSMFGCGLLVGIGNVSIYVGLNWSIFYKSCIHCKIHNQIRIGVLTYS